MGDKFPIGGIDGVGVCGGGDFVQEDFVLNHLQFVKWETNYQSVELMELLIKRKVSQHFHNYFH